MLALIVHAILIIWEIWRKDESRGAQVKYAVGQHLEPETVITVNFKKKKKNWPKQVLLYYTKTSSYWTHAKSNFKVNRLMIHLNNNKKPHQKLKAM